LSARLRASEKGPSESVGLVMTGDITHMITGSPHTMELFLTTKYFCATALR